MENQRNMIIKIFNENIGVKNKIIASNIPTHLEIIFPKKANHIYISSDSKYDSFNNKGANTIFINGLDENYNEINDIIKLNGIIPEITKKKFLRINNMLVGFSGELNSNQGNIYAYCINNMIVKGVPSNNLYHIIGKYENISSCGIFTVPKNYNLQLKFYDASSNIEKGEYLEITPNFDTKIFSPFNLAKIYLNHYNSNVDYNIKYANIFGEKTDISLWGRKKYYKKNFFKRLLSKIINDNKKIKLNSWLQFVLIKINDD